MTTRRTDTKDPRGSRERALKILFQADVRGVSPDVTLARLTEDQSARAILDEVEELSEDGELLPPKAGAGDQVDPASAGPPLDGFTIGLVLGVHERKIAIDELISRFARKWQIHRMPVVDRTVLRLATFELIQEQTSPAIIINEAVGLAKALSTDDSGRYVNGVLESIRKHLAAQALESDSTIGNEAAVESAGVDEPSNEITDAEPESDGDVEPGSGPGTEGEAGDSDVVEPGSDTEFGRGDDLEPGSGVGAGNGDDFESGFDAGAVADDAELGFDDGAVADVDADFGDTDPPVVGGLSGLAGLVDPSQGRG